MATTHPFTRHRASRPEARALRVGRALKRRRIALGLRQADLAVMTGISREDYELVETGEWPGQPTEAYVAELLAAVVRALDSELIRQARAAS